MTENRLLKLGQSVTLTKAMLGNAVGTLGFVVEEYGEDGVMIIFQNGEYDGFSRDEQERYLKIGEVNSRYSSYQFQNVLKLSDDYRRNYWVFKPQ